MTLPQSTRVLVLPMLVAAGFFFCGRGHAQPVPGGFRVYKADRGTVIRHVTLPAKVRADQQATIYAKVPGYLEILRVDRGDVVKRGQLLAEIQAPELAAELQGHKADHAVAERELARLQAAKEQAPDLVVEQALDEARGKMEVARAQMARVSTLLRYTRLVAPFAGVVTERFVDAGAFIPAATTGKAAAVVTLMKLNVVRVQIAVPEVESVHVQKGQPVRFFTDVLPGRTFEAKVSRFGYALDSKTQTMLVEADIGNDDLSLRPGMFVTARIGVQRHDDVVKVPADAVLVEKAGSSVFKLVNGKAHKTRVKTAFNDGEFVEISGGLAPETTVVRFGRTVITDGQAIAVMP